MGLEGYLTAAMRRSPSLLRLKVTGVDLETRDVFRHFFNDGGRGVRILDFNVNILRGKLGIG